MKSDWAHISREVTVALSTNPTPKLKRKVIPIVSVRKSALRTEQSRVVLGRLA
jgi:hypothetical protein